MGITVSKVRIESFDYDLLKPLKSKFLGVSEKVFHYLICIWSDNRSARSMPCYKMLKRPKIVVLTRCDAHHVLRNFIETRGLRKVRIERQRQPNLNRGRCQFLKKLKILIERPRCILAYPVNADTRYM